MQTKTKAKAITPIHLLMWNGFVVGSASGDDELAAEKARLEHLYGSGITSQTVNCIAKRQGFGASLSEVGW